MTNWEKYFDPDALARLSSLELKVHAVVEGMISGLHRSPYNGQSVEFIDHREYVPGDDPRHIDWKVLGRADRIVIKRYEEDTNLRGHLILDASESMRYGQPGRLTKYDYAGTLAASLAFLLNRQHDAISLSLFDGKIAERVPLSTHPTTLMNVAQTISNLVPKEKTDLEPVLSQLAQELPRRGMVTIISDFFAPIDKLEKGLQELRAKKQEVILIHVMDQTELTFPFEGNTLFKGLEDYPEVMLDPRAVRDAYLEEIQEFLDEMEAMVSRVGVDYRLAPTHEPFDIPIVSILAQRAQARGGRR